MNPRWPAPVNARTATVKRITDAIFGALHQALPGRLPAANSGEQQYARLAELGSHRAAFTELVRLPERVA